MAQKQPNPLPTNSWRPPPSPKPPEVKVVSPVLTCIVGYQPVNCLLTKPTAPPKSE